MFLGTLEATLLGILLKRTGTFRAGEGTIRADQNFLCRFIFEQILKYKSIMKMNLNVMVFIQEKINLI